MKLLADQDVYGVTTNGVILMRGSPGTIEEVHRELECLFEEHKEEELKGLFCVVEPGRHRLPPRCPLAVEIGAPSPILQTMEL